ncbi:MAG: nucleotidyltransferase domain-containing protein [Cellulomonadaceae bacterium]|jgi:predicted nucleotidyltransferase|nr:nucleotidyltransferase domain-containing protein [Cellulomonadaceae bacterium]
MYGLSDSHYSQIGTVLSQNGVKSAVIFGSRAKGIHRPNSDIDIAIFDSEVNVNHIAQELDDLPSPYKFDVVEYHRLENLALREHIIRVGQPLHL